MSVVNPVFADQAPTVLRCEMLSSPAAAISGNMPSITSGIKDNSPEFGWVVNSDIVNDTQTAWQIMVASDATMLEADKPDIWDSKKNISDNSVNVRYEGKALSINQSIFLEGSYLV